MKRFILLLSLLLSLSLASGQTPIQHGVLSSSSQGEVVYDVDYQAVLNYSTSQGITLPDARTRQRQSDLVTAWKASGLWAKRILLYVPAGDPNAIAFATLNWKSPSTFRLLENGTLTFSEKGFKGNGTTGFLNTQWNPSTDGGGLYAQNAASVSSFISSHATEATLDYGASDGTSQIILNSLAVSPANTARHVVNDNTNSDLSPIVTSVGLHFSERTSSTAKSIWKDQVTASASVNSTGLPNRTVYLLARNASGTANSFSSRTIGMWGTGSTLTPTEKINSQTAWLNYYLAQQEPLYIVTDDPEATGALIGVGGSGAWDETSVFGVARYGNILFYGGTNDEREGSVRRYEIGAFDLSDDNTGTKDAANPIVTRTELSLTGTNEGIIPRDVWDDGTNYIYLVCSVNEGTNNEVNTGVLRAPRNDPKNLSNFSRILTAGGTGHFNHGASFFEDPAQPTKLFIVYTHRNTSSDPLRINIAEALKSSDLLNSASWSVIHTNIWTSSPTTINQVYPKIIWDATRSNFKLWCGRFYGALGEDSFTIYTTENTVFSSFPEGKETSWPSNLTGAVDRRYTSTPQPYFLIPDTSGKLYQSTRLNGAAGNYIAIKVRDFEYNPNQY